MTTISKRFFNKLTFVTICFSNVSYIIKKTSGNPLSMGYSYLSRLLLNLLRLFLYIFRLFLNQNLDATWRGTLWKSEGAHEVYFFSELWHYFN